MKRYNFPKYFVVSTMAFTVGTILGAPSLEFNGNTLKVLNIAPEKNTGLDNIYIVYDTEGVGMTYPTDNPLSVKIYRYSNLGGGYAEEVTRKEIVLVQGGVIINNIEGDMGYIIEDGNNRYFYWIVNYKPYRFSVNSIELSPESDCDYTRLEISPQALPIHYYTINGQQRILSRDIEIDFENQEWDTDAKSFKRIVQTKIVESITGETSITPPAYCATYYTVKGDRFLKEWNWLQTKESSVYQPKAVKVQTWAEQLSDGGEDTDQEGVKSNEIKSESDGLGGSAPAQIIFHAETTEGVLHNEWQLTKDPNFENIEYRFNEKDLDYTFTEEGTCYLRFVGSNSDGSCESYSDVYTVTIGTSELKCPNAFSPDGDGVNDEWKVSYRSIIDFDCWIFDRYGHEIIHLDKPDQGWDGKRGGKVVKPGVYYYVIRATGADGKEYKKSGDINIIRHNIGNNVNGGSSNE